MPCYEFYCVRCAKPFVVTLGTDVVDRQDIRCPSCGNQLEKEMIGPLVGDPLPLAEVESFREASSA